MLRNYTEKDILLLSALRMASNDVHIWMIKWRSIREWLLEYSYLLNKDGRRMAAGYRFEEDRWHYLTGRILTKILASHYLVTKPDEIIIGFGKYGKPFIFCRDGSKLQHNLSHSGEYVLLAFTYKMAIGTDIEEQRELPAFIKAYGKGLFIRLDSFMIRGQGIYNGSKQLDAWKLYIFEAAPNYQAALVISQK